MFIYYLMAELVASLLQNDETTADIKVAFKLLKNTFQNISVTVSTMKYRISDAANDLKVMKESFFDLIQDLLYHSSKDVAKKVSGMCVVYSLLLFLNANVKKHHTFEFELDKCGDKKDILSSHNVWDSMWRLEKTISETLFCISPATFADLVARESEITALLYAEIVKNPGMRFEEWKPFGYDEHYSRFYCVLHFYRVFDGPYYTKGIVDGMHARAKNQIYDCQCRADRLAAQALGLPNKDVARTIVKAAGGANNVQPGLYFQEN